MVCSLTYYVTTNEPKAKRLKKMIIIRRITRRGFDEISAFISFSPCLAVEFLSKYFCFAVILARPFSSNKPIDFAVYLICAKREKKFEMHQFLRKMKRVDLVCNHTAFTYVGYIRCLFGALSRKTNGKHIYTLICACAIIRLGAHAHVHKF